MGSSNSAASNEEQGNCKKTRRRAKKTPLEKKKQSWCWKNWDVNRDAQVSHDAADRRCEAAAGGGGNDAPVKIINRVWHRRSRLARQRGVGGLSPANHTRLGVFSNSQSLIFPSTGLTAAQQTEKRRRQSHFFSEIWDYLRLSSSAKMGWGRRCCPWGGVRGPSIAKGCISCFRSGKNPILELMLEKKKFNRRHCRR